MGSPRAVLRRLPGVAGAGLAGWTVDVTVLWVGHVVFGVATAVAAAAGFIASGIVNYTLNRLVFTGRAPAGVSRTAPGRLRRYGTLFVANLAIVTLAVPLLADALPRLMPAVPAPLLGAKILVTALLLPVNTLLYGAWVFPSVTDVGSEAHPARVDQVLVDEPLIGDEHDAQRNGGGR